MAPSSRTNFTDAAKAMKTIVGSVPTIPLAKLFMVFLKSPEARNPARGPNIRKYAARITTT